MLWGRVLHRSYYHASILNIDVSRAKNPPGPGKRSGASAHVRRGELRSLRKGTVSSKIAALIGAKTISCVFPVLAGISISIPADHPARFLVHHNRRSWRISALSMWSKGSRVMGKNVQVSRFQVHRGE